MAQTPRNRLNILFTSVGRRVELIRAFRRAYSKLDLDGNIVALDVDPLAPALQEVDRPFIVPRLSDEAYIPTLSEICRRESVDLVFPLIDPDIPCLAANKEVLEETGARLAVVSSDAATETADKFLTSRFFQRLHLPVPRTWLPEESPFIDLNYPLFIKPRSGSAARNTFKVNNDRELRFFLDYISDPMIQEFLPGPEITNDVICNMDGQLLGVASRQRIEVRWGEVAKGITVFDQRILDACKAIARALPAIGPITVQCMMKNDIPHYTEINARMGGGLPLAVAAGVDAPTWLLASAAGIQVHIPEPGHYKTGLFMTRYDESFFLRRGNGLIQNESS